MQRRTTLTAAAALAAVLVGTAGASAEAPPPEPEHPTIANPGFESGKWGEHTQHYHSEVVSPGAGGSGYAARIGLAYANDEAQTPIGSDLPVRGTGTDRGMVNKTVTGIEPNTEYEFSVTLKGTDIRWGIFDTESSLYYRGLARGDGGGNYDAGITTPGGGTEWKTYTTRITTGPRTTELNAFCFIGGQGPGWCDNFEITRVGPAEDPQQPPETWEEPPLGENGFPVTIPAVQHFSGTEGTWNGPISRIVVDEQDRDLISDEAHLGAANLTEATGEEISLSYGTAEQTPAGEVFLQIGDIELPEEAPEKAQSLEADAYTIDITAERITITAGGQPGALYALSTLTQALESTPGKLPTGVVRDWTDMAFRGLQVDSGRRFYSIDWLKQQIKDLAYTHMNTMVLRVKDGQGLRVESDVFPELVDDLPDGGHWTKEQIADLVDFADRYHVTIIPEFDMPAHATLDTKLFDDDYMLGGEAYNYARADVRQRLQAVAVEMGETFDSPYVHVGGDEFMSMEEHQEPVDWIREKTGNPDAGARDAFVAFLNGVNDALQAHGREMLMWNDMLDGSNQVVELDQDITIVYWAKIYDSLSAEQLTERGYQVIGSSSDRYHDLWPVMNTRDQTSGSERNGDVINRPLPQYAWEHYNSPFIFSGGFDPPATLPDTQHDMVRGQFFPIWDDAHGWAPEHVLTQTLMPRLRLFSQMVWNSPRPTESFAQFDPYVRHLGHAAFFGTEQDWQVPEVPLEGPAPTQEPSQEPSTAPTEPETQEPTPEPSGSEGSTAPVTPPSASHGAPGRQDPLPDTGTSLVGIGVLTALMLIGGGAALLTRRRQRLQ